MGAHDGCLSIFRACNPNIGVPRHFAKWRCGTPIFGLHALRGLSNCHLASPFQATFYRPCAPITFMLDEAVPNDIDRVISGVKTKIPEVYVVQMHKSHPADDDGLWWFRIPGIAKNIQVESAS